MEIERSDALDPNIESDWLSPGRVEFVARGLSSEDINRGAAFLNVVGENLGTEVTVLDGLVFDIQNPSADKEDENRVKLLQVAATALGTSFARINEVTDIVPQLREAVLAREAEEAALYAAATQKGTKQKKNDVVHAGRDAIRSAPLTLRKAATATIESGKEKALAAPHTIKERAKTAGKIAAVSLLFLMPATPLVILPAADGLGWITSDDEKPPSDITGVKQVNPHKIEVKNKNDMYSFTVEEVAIDGVVANGKFVLRSAFPDSEISHHPDKTADYGIGIFNSACHVDDFNYSGSGDSIELDVVTKQPNCLTVLVDFINNPPVHTGGSINTVGGNLDTTGTLPPVGQ